MRLGPPPKAGLYDPQFEHEACGVGFIVNIKGRKSHAIIQQALQVLRSHSLGKDAASIGTVTAQHPRMLVARTAMGSNRVIPTQIGEQLPRIC